METERDEDRRREKNQEAYARGWAHGRAGVFHPPYAGLAAAGIKTSSSTANITESHSAADFTIEDDLADDIVSIMKRLDKGIAAESRALDRLIYRMAAVQLPVSG
ncbi:MAG: hypothetical protein AB7H90_00800 [Alphaproteobacteria bacterium]